MTIFALESDQQTQKKIKEEYNGKNFLISFFPSNSSIFEIMQLNPDVIIQDYHKRQIINCREL